MTFYGKDSKMHSTTRSTAITSDAVKKPPSYRNLTTMSCRMKSKQTLCPVMKGFYLLLGLILSLSESIHADSTFAYDPYGNNVNVTFSPSSVDGLLYGESITIAMKCYYGGPNALRLRVVSEDASIADVLERDYIVEPGSSTSPPTEATIRHPDVNFTNFSLTIKGVFLGRTHLHVFTNISVQNSSVDRSQKSDWFRLPGIELPVIVTRENDALNHIFTGSIVILVILANIAMGCKVDLAVVKETMKRPIAPCIGLFSQFIIMPLIGFAVSQMFHFEPVIALALLATGCAPGGGASNTYTFLAGGNVSLSVTMTLISTLASLGLVPLWLFTLGSLYVYRDGAFKIPYKQMIISLVGLVLPVLVGVVIQRKRPAWVRPILRIILPFLVVLILVVLSVGIYANLYIFKLFRPDIIAAGALLPNAGFVIGGLLALVFQQSWKDVKTIIIETGLQNTGIPIILLLSLPKPDSDLAIVAPIAAAIFTPIILWVFIIARLIVKKCRRQPPQKSGCEKKGIPEVESSLCLEDIPCRQVEIMHMPEAMRKLSGNVAYERCMT